MKLSKKFFNKFEFIILPIIFIVSSFLFILPLMRQGVIYSGDDLSYHIERLNELYLNYQKQNFYPLFATFGFNKIGYPVNIFYPWITLIPFVLIRLIIHNPVISIYLGIAFYSLLTMVFTYIVTRKVLAGKFQSCLTALIYCFCAYRSIDIFARFALGEYISLTFYPLVFYGFYAVMFGNKKDWWYLGLGLSFILLSHVLSTFIICFVLFILFICSVYFVTNFWSTIGALLKSVLLFSFSSCIFFVPFIEQVSYQKYLQPSIDPLHLTRLTFSNLILESLNNNLNGALRTSGSTYNIGIVLFIVAIIGIFKFANWNPLYKAVYVIGVLSALCSTNLIPWLTLERTPLSIIQFPWRFLGLSSFMLSVSAGYIINDVYRSLTNKSKMLLTVLVPLCIVMPWFSGIQTFKIQEEAFMHVYNRYDNQLNGSLFLDQYIPETSQKSLSDLVSHTSIIDGKRLRIKDIKSSSNSLVFKNQYFKGAKTVILPLVSYKNISVFQGNSECKFHRNKNGLIVLDNVKRSMISVVYRLSFLDKLAVFISISTWILMTLFIVIQFADKKVKDQ